MEPGKTNGVNIAFEDKKGNLRLKPPQENNNLTIRNTDGETEHIEQLHVNTAQKTLGVFRTITGNENSEVQYLLEKVKKWKENVQKSYLGHEDSRCAVSTKIGKTLSYPLPATSFNKKQSDLIVDKFLAAALSKSGIVRSTARKIILAPSEVMGFGYDDINTLQIAEHISIMIYHGKSNMVTGKLIRLLAEGMKQVLAGI